MTKMLTSLALALLLGWPPAVHAQPCGAPFVDPSVFGQQAQASIDAAGQYVIKRSITHQVCETQYRTETRTKEVVDADGNKGQVNYSVQIPVMVCKPVARYMQFNAAADKVQAFDMQGKAVSAEKLASALQEEQTVLLATRKVPKYYLSVYQADTLLLVVDPMMQQYASQPILSAPVPLQAGRPVAPSPAPGPAAPPTAPAPVAPPTEAPRPAPAPVVSAPAAYKAEASSPTGMEPMVSMARSADSKLGLRYFTKQVATETARREVTAGGKKKQVDFAIEVESIVDVERKYPLEAVKIRRADKKPVSEADLAKLLATDRCVLVSTDGQEIDARFLKIVKPDALIVVAPIPAPPAPPVLSMPPPGPGVSLPMRVIPTPTPVVPPAPPAAPAKPVNDEA